MEPATGIVKQKSGFYVKDEVCALERTPAWIFWRVVLSRSYSTGLNVLWGMYVAL